MNSLISRARLMRITFVTSLIFLPPTATRADTRYQPQAMLRVGTSVGDVTLGDKWELVIGDLNDRGQVVVVAGDVSTPNPGGVLLQYSDGQWIPIAAHGRPGPRVTWPVPTFIDLPVRMNEKGNVVFATESGKGQTLELGTYRWDYATRTVIPIAVKGMPAANGLVFEQGGSFTPVINERDEVVFPAAVKNAQGKAANGIFFAGQDGKIQPVVLSDQELPGGAQLYGALLPSLNDGGLVTFLTTNYSGTLFNGAYLWEQGVITPLAVVGAQTSDGQKISEVTGAWVNSKNHTVLVALAISGKSGHSLYRFADGKLTPLAVRGQEMPGGGQLADVDTLAAAAVSWANAAGQHAFNARLVDGSRAAYLLDAGGALSLIVKTGTRTDLGTITHVSSGGSFGVALNNNGQVALTVRFDNGPKTVVLLTPAPQ